MKQARWLVVVPTEMESTLLKKEFGRAAPGSENAPSLQWHLCGFGPVVAAARVMQLIHQIEPQRVVLLGIAGVYENFQAACPIGSATRFTGVACDGIGAGEGESHQSAASLGWNQWPANENSIGDSLSLDPMDVTGTGPAIARQLLTVCSAAGDQAQADRRQVAFPTAIAEDMEAFGVAVACHLQGLPCSVIRGISNRAGIRDKQHWDIPAALQAAARTLAQAIELP